MVRTKADCLGMKASGAKAPRKIVQQKPASQPSTSGCGSSGRNSGGNVYKPQPTPDWQKEITTFLVKKEESHESLIDKDTTNDSEKVTVVVKTEPIFGNENSELRGGEEKTID